MIEFMNLNDRRLGAYNRILKKVPDDSAKSDTSNATSGNEASGKVPAPKASPSAGSTDRKASAMLPGLVKVPRPSSGAETPYRRVAKFLLLVGVEEAAKILARLSPDQTEKVVLELASIRSVSKDEAAVVLAEFESLLLKAREPSGGVETARSILEAAFGPERAEEMLKKAVPDAGGKPFDYLEGIDPAKLYRLVYDELPAVKALVLSQLKPAQAASVIAEMTDEDKKETVLRLAKLRTINPDVLRRVDGAMREKVLSMQTSSADSIDGRSALAEILKRMDSGSEQSILNGLDSDDPELGRDLRERLFTLNDIVRADDRFLQETIRILSDRDVAVLLAGKTPEFREKILNNISRTRKALVLDEEAVVAPVSRQESARVTGSFFSTVRRAWENGSCFISGRDDEDVWVH